MLLSPVNGVEGARRRATTIAARDSQMSRGAGFRSRNYRIPPR